MNKDIKRFFIDEEMIGKEHECNCNGECGGDCKCHQEEVKIDVNDIVFDKYGQPYADAEEVNRRLYVACSRCRNKLYLKFGK